MRDLDTTVHRARLTDLGPQVLYDLLRLRSAVFVVEQECVFLDMDGRDHEADAEHLWLADGDGAVATLRILHEDGDVWSIGRVVTRPDARSAGTASRLVRAALDRVSELGATEVVIGAQAHLADWYGRFGFEVHGEPYVEDGIPHVPMTRTFDPR